MPGVARTSSVSTGTCRVDRAWVGRRVMGDTMLGCGACRRCRRGHQHVCEKRQEVGIRGERAGALAEQLAVPVSSLHVLPDSVDAVLGEPSYRRSAHRLAVEAAASSAEASIAEILEDAVARRSSDPNQGRRLRRVLTRDQCPP